MPNWLGALYLCKEMYPMKGSELSCWTCFSTHRYCTSRWVLKLVQD